MTSISVFRLVVVPNIGDDNAQDYTTEADAMKDFRKLSRHVGRSLDELTLWHAHSDKPWERLAHCSWEDT